MLSVDAARALITTSLSDADLADVIAREEAWLARRIGPLDGELVETFLPMDGDEVLNLTRPTRDVTVEDDTGDRSLDVEVRGWSDLCLIDGAASWSGDVFVTYTPTDSDEVQRALVTLVRLTVSESAYAAQSAGGYTAQVSYADQKAMRYVAWRSLLRTRTPTTTRLRSIIPFGGKILSAVVADSTDT